LVFRVESIRVELTTQITGRHFYFATDVYSDVYSAHAPSLNTVGGRHVVWRRAVMMTNRPPSLRTRGVCKWCMVVVEVRAVGAC
jgi:hypothetical protein